MHFSRESREKRTHHVAHTPPTYRVPLLLTRKTQTIWAFFDVFIDFIMSLQKRTHNYTYYFLNFFKTQFASRRSAFFALELDIQFAGRERFVWSRAVLDPHIYRARAKNAALRLACKIAISHVSRKAAFFTRAHSTEYVCRERHLYGREPCLYILYITQRVGATTTAVRTQRVLYWGRSRVANMMYSVCVIYVE